jgi:hypothetical protein
MQIPEITQPAIFKNYQKSAELPNQPGWAFLETGARGGTQLLIY